MPRKELARTSDCDLQSLVPGLPSRFRDSLLLGVSLTYLASAQTMSPRQVFARYRPSVVSIETRTRSETKLGTGFVFEDDQTIVTCYHVLKGALSITILNVEGEKWTPWLISFDEKSDLAVIRLEDKTFRTPLVHALPGTVGEGDRVVVIGNPLGMKGVVSEGIVSAIGEADAVPKILFSAPFSHGSSGSPVIDSEGRVVGVGGSILTEGQNLNLATDVRVALSIYDGLQGAGISSPFPVRTLTGFMEAERDVLTSQSPVKIHNPFEEIGPQKIVVPKRTSTSSKRAKTPTGLYDDIVVRVVGRLGILNKGSLIYAKPSLKSKILKRMPDEAFVTIRKTQAVWTTLLLPNGESGYVLSRLVKNYPYDVMSNGRRVRDP